MPDSKTRRALRRKRELVTGATASMPAHAQLIDASGAVIGGIAMRDGAWVLVLGGKPAATTDSAGMAIAMLRHTAALLGRTGPEITASWSGTLRDLATAEAAASDRTLESYLEFLEAERAELQAWRSAPSPTLQ